MHALPAPQRNQLVWLTQDGWQSVLAHNWDASALGILRHWRDAQLPLVVTARRGDAFPGFVSVGLPAPTCWGRRKLALQVPLHALERLADFPSPEQLEPSQLPWEAVQPFKAHMAHMQVPVHVYGSFGWQHLTGMDYVRATSDLDLRACVPNLAAACTVALALDALQLPLRVDGELALPDGSAVAWRELLQWMRGTVQQVLVKSRAGVQLVRLPGEPCSSGRTHRQSLEGCAA